MNRREVSERHRLLAATIDALPENERVILFLYYDDEQLLREIGEKIKLTESRIARFSAMPSGACSARCWRRTVGKLTAAHEVSERRTLKSNVSLGTDKGVCERGLGLGSLPLLFSRRNFRCPVERLAGYLLLHGISDSRRQSGPRRTIPRAAAEWPGVRQHPNLPPIRVSASKTRARRIQEGERAAVIAGLGEET
jgi:hypothetical protein